MRWKSVEINPDISKIYLVMGFDKMFYFAKFCKRNKKWSSFTHFVGPLDNNDTWTSRIQVRFWYDLDKVKINKILMGDNTCDNCGKQFEICYRHWCEDCS